MEAWHVAQCARDAAWSDAGSRFGRHDEVCAGGFLDMHALVASSVVALNLWFKGAIVVAPCGREIVVIPC
jgi:hypothetical protein